MRKEVILAVIIGVLLGGIILYGINLANKSSILNQDIDNLLDKNSQTTPTLSPKKDDQISIVYPQNNSVITEDKITLKGVAKPNSSIAIITENDDLIITADTSGNFTSLINLINGENQVSVTAVDENQATSSASIIVIHTDNLPE